MACQAQEAAGIPESFKANVGQLVGQWTTEGKYNGEAFQGLYSAAWNDDQTCLLLTSSGEVGARLDGIGGWDPAGDEYVETWYRTDGVRFEQRFKLDSQEHWTGSVIMSTSDGKTETGTIDLKFRDGNQFDFEGTTGNVTLIQNATKTLDQSASHADFEAFVKAFRGRWIGEVTWIADWEGIGGKKGNKITAHAEIKTRCDGNLLHCIWYGGNSVFDWLVYFDAGDKKIRSVSVDSGGLVQHATFWKDGNDWQFQQTGSEADGSRVISNGRVTVTESGKVHTWTGDTSIDGKPVAPLRDVFRRVTDQ